LDVDIAEQTVAVYPQPGCNVNQQSHLTAAYM